MKRAIILLVLILAAGSVTAADQDVDMDAVLEDVDRLRQFMDSDLTSVMNMVTEDPDTGVEKMEVHSFRRDYQDEFLLLIKQPEVQKGQGYLRKGDNLWFYDPESRKFTHSSMKENFQDTSSKNSDFGRLELSTDYKVASWTEGKLGKFDVYILDLEGVNNEVTYPHLKLWVTKDTHLVLKSEDYSLTKRLMRTSYYPEYAKAGDSFIPVKMIFIDELIEGKKTQITISDISLADLPDSVFTKAYVERVNR
jgi:outer membrane lipoprotein-sorting protein